MNGADRERTAGDRAVNGADRERTAVYAAEVAAFDGTDLETIVSFERLVELVTTIVDGRWWPGQQVTVVRTRRDAASSSTRCGGTSAEIRLAEPQMTIATVTHELAHALAGAHVGHGATFRRAHLDVVLVGTNLHPLNRRGPVHVDQLRHAYVGAGLTIGERTWPTPPAVDGPIAL